MKTLRLFLLLLLMPLLSKAASPSYNSFLTEQFTNNGIKIGLNTDYVLTWQQVNTNYLTTNGYNLTVNTGALAAAIGSLSLPFNPTQFSTNGGQVSLTNTVVFTNATAWNRMSVDVTGNTASPQFVVTNSSGNHHAFYLDSGTISYTAYGASAASAAFFTVSAGDRSSFALWTRSNNLPDLRFMRWMNQSNRTYLERLNDNFTLNSPAFIVTNNAPADSLVLGADGIVRFNASGGGSGYADNTRQFTAATNAVRVFAGTGTTVTTTNNTGNGSLDYRIDASGGGSQTPILQDVNYAQFNATNIGTLNLKATNVLSATDQYGDLYMYSSAGSNNALMVHGRGIANVRIATESQVDKGPHIGINPGNWTNSPFTFRLDANTNFGFFFRSREETVSSVGSFGARIGATSSNAVFEAPDARHVVLQNSNRFVRIGNETTAMRTASGSSNAMGISLSGAISYAGENTAASSSAGGAFAGLWANDGAAMASGDRLGGFLLGGSSSSSSLRSSVLLSAFASQAWTDGSAYGSEFRIETTANGSTARAANLVVGNAGAIQFNAYGAGTLTTDASGNITAVSDERLKDITGLYGAGLPEILQISPILYRWNAASKFEPDTVYAGFSAQQIQAIMPEAVGVMKDGHLTLQDRALIAALVNAVKTLSAEVEELKERVAELELKP